MQFVGILACRRRSFELLDELAQPSLLGLRHDEKFHPDALRSAPPDGGILNFQGNGLAGKVQEEGDLHAREGREEAFDPAPLGRKIPDGTFVPELVPLNHCTGHADEKPAVLASNHVRRPCYECYAAAAGRLCKY